MAITSLGTELLYTERRTERWTDRMTERQK